MKSSIPLLVKHGACVNQVFNGSRVPLLVAIERGNEKHAHCLALERMQTLPERKMARLLYCLQAKMDMRLS